MTDEREIEDKFWSELKDSPLVMLGVEGAPDGATQPMTAVFHDEDRDAGRLWFFTSTETDLVRSLGETGQAVAAFSSKGHDLFASLRGELTIETGREAIDRLWSPFVAEWYESKDDPKLALLRLDVDNAKIWLSDAEAFSKPAFNKLLGRPPEAGLEDKVAEVSF